MPRAAKPARLWLKPATSDRASVWIIKDGDKRVSTMCGADDQPGAERFLNSYLGAKHDPAGQPRRPIDEVPIADVISVYLDDIVAASARLAQGRDRMGRLMDWWGAKALSYQRPYTLTFAQFRVVIEAIAFASCAKKFQASQQASTMWS